MKYYQGKFSPKNPKKYRGDSTNIIFRSSWELRAMKHFDDNDNIVFWCSEEICIPYRDPVTGSYRRYFPDFIIGVKQISGDIKTFVIEIKPLKQTIEPKIPIRKTRGFLMEVATWGTNQAKWESAHNYCLEKGWKFMIMTEKDLGL